MACNTLIDLLKSCDNNSGGIYTAKIFDMDDVTDYTYDPATWEVTGLTLSTTASVFEFKRNTSNYTEELANDLINGSGFVTGTINLVFHRREAAKSKAIKILGDGQRYLGVVVGDANGKFWYFPYAQLTASGEGSGTARADGSKYTVTLVAENDFFAYEVPSAIETTL